MEPSESQSEEIMLECERMNPKKRLRTNTLGDLIIERFELEENEFSYQKIRTENYFDLNIKSYFQERKIFSEREISTLIKNYYEEKKYNVMESTRSMIFTKKDYNTIRIEITKETHHGLGPNVRKECESCSIYDSYNIKAREYSPLSDVKWH